MMIKNMRGQNGSNRFFSSYHKFVDGGKKRGGRHQPGGTALLPKAP